MNIPISDGIRHIYYDGGPPQGDVERVLESINALHYIASRSKTIGLYALRGAQLSKGEELALKHQEFEMWRTAR